ncbi:hypothetical protein C0389_10340 [bacterium]|nr:hypothetical protein [bacterium]
MKKMFLLLTVIVLFYINLFSQSITNRQLLITIRDVWIRPAAAEANTALFFEVVNNSSLPDTLLSATGKISELVEVHETYKKENDVMSMREVQKVVVPPHSIVKFKPRGLHVMIIGLLKDIRLGEKHEITLEFKNAGRIKVKAVVRDMPAMK